MGRMKGTHKGIDGVGGVDGGMGQDRWDGVNLPFPRSTAQTSHLEFRSQKSGSQKSGISGSRSQKEGALFLFFFFIYKEVC